MRIPVLVSILFAAVQAVTASVPDFEREEYASRRTRLMELLPDGIIVVRNSTGDKPNLDFLYLCGVRIPQAILVMDAPNQKTYLFYSANANYLKGEGLNPDLASNPIGTTGADFWYPAARFTAVLDSLASMAKVVYTPHSAEESNADVSTRSEWDGRLTRERQFALILGERYPGREIRDCSRQIWDLRLLKSPAEVEKLRMAGRIGAEAANAVMKAAKPGMYEYELSALFEYECRRKGCREMAFEVIISSAENHEYLHYSQHDRLLQDGDFVVLDAGPTWEGYDTDLTVSFPVNGKFTARQREIYEACRAVSLACLDYYKPGITGYEVGRLVRERLAGEGYDLDSDAFTRLRFFREGGITHPVGLAVHDCGGSDIPKDLPLKAGMVFACDVFATFPGEDLGVRVENTVLITDTGCEVLTPGILR